jgi:hypothetical protein
MIFKGSTEELEEKTCPSATLSTINPVWNEPDVNPDVSIERPAMTASPKA